MINMGRGIFHIGIKTPQVHVLNVCTFENEMHDEKSMHSI